jgi:hypothetical protein
MNLDVLDSETCSMSLIQQSGSQNTISLPELPQKVKIHSRFPVIDLCPLKFGNHILAVSHAERDTSECQTSVDAEQRQLPEKL